MPLFLKARGSERKKCSRRHRHRGGLAVGAGELAALSAAASARARSSEPRVTECSARGEGAGCPGRLSSGTRQAVPYWEPATERRRRWPAPASLSRVDARGRRAAGMDGGRAAAALVEPDERRGQWRATREPVRLQFLCHPARPPPPPRTEETPRTLTRRLHAIYPAPPRNLRHAAAFCAGVATI
jgi:hypothetical protein